MLVSDMLTKEEVQRFTERNDFSALRIVLGNWLMIVGIFAAVAYWTHPISIAIAIILLGGRQLGIAVLVHDCGHGTMFTRLSWNRFVARWLAAPFIFSDADAYRVRHNKHHRLGGTKEDPDLPNYVNYAVARRSFYRKILRDLTGRTGWKTLRLSAKGYGPKAVMTWVAANGLMFGILLLSGHGWLYLMWPAAWMTSHMLIVRIRQAAEHGSVPDLLDPDPRKHTRTTYARWWERLLLAPNNVNYHLEHHILASVPCYRLPEFHAYLKAQGHLDTAELCNGYWDVIKKLVQPSSAEKGQAVPASS